jgi:L-fuconolactonase
MGAMPPGRVDAHQHFLDPARWHYPWMREANAALRQRFGPEELVPCLRRTGVVGTVVVQARHDLTETEELLSLAARTRFVAGVVGWVDLTAPHVSDELARLREGPGGQLLVGIRHQVHDEPDPAFLTRPEAIRGLEAVAQAGLTFDLLVRTRELSAAVAAVRAVPGCHFVLDHLAKPPLASGQLADWAKALAPLAAAPNVVCKVSGLVTEASWNTWTPIDLAPALEVATELFGTDRLLFGSDWPVCLLAASYDEVVGTVEGLTEGWTSEERRKLFRDNAISTYNLHRSSRELWS